MAERLPTLSTLHAFERVAYHLSVKRAAEDLFVTSGAVSQRIKQLETELGVPLFHRQGRNLHLSPAGKSFYRDVSRAFARIQTGVQRIRDQFGAQIVRLHLLPFFASEILIPRLHDFHLREPNIDVRIESAFGNQETLPDGADMAIALGDGKWTDLVSHHLMSLEIQPVATPELAEALTKDEEQALQSQTLIRFSSRLDAWEQWAKSTNFADFKPGQMLTVDSMFSALNAAQQGLGIALAIRPVTDERVSQMGLTYVSRKAVDAEVGYHLVYRRSDAVRPALIAFRDWLLEQFA